MTEKNHGHAGPRGDPVVGVSFAYPPLNTGSLVLWLWFRGKKKEKEKSPNNAQDTSIEELRTERKLLVKTTFPIRSASMIEALHPIKSIVRVKLKRRLSTRRISASMHLPDIEVPFSAEELVFPFFYILVPNMFG